MKIAFTGASSTGKTSVAQSFFESDANRILGYSVINVDSRWLLSSLGLGLANNISSCDYRIFQTMYISQKLFTEKAADHYITARSFADCLAYWRMHCANTATSSEDKLIEALCRNMISRYDQHFFFPTGFFALQQDGFRHTGEEYHSQFEETLLDILNTEDVQFIRMPPAGITERVEFLVGHLNG